MASAITCAIGQKLLRMVTFSALTIVLGSGSAAAQERGGFTALVDLGVGIQSDSSIDETETGLAGVSVGIGGFLTRDLALMFRITGTTVAYDFGAAGDYVQTSGVAGAALQFWLSDRFNLEAGAGVGFWSGDNDEGNGRAGLILGAGVTLLNRGKHNLQFGIQYAPAFTDPGTVHNIGFTIGYQFL